MCDGVLGLWTRVVTFSRGVPTQAACPCRSRDFYHTCYCLSGLSIAQHFGSGAMLHDVVLGVPENALVSQDGMLNTLLHRVPRIGDFRAAPRVLQNWVYSLCGQAGKLVAHQ